MSARWHDERQEQDSAAYYGDPYDDIDTYPSTHSQED